MGEPIPEPQPLDYRTPAKAPRTSFAASIGFLIGLFSGVVAPAALGVGAFILGYENRGQTVFAAGWFVVTLVALAGFVRLIARGRRLTPQERAQAWRFCLIGFLLSVMLVSLVEGVCFLQKLEI